MRFALLPKYAYPANYHPRKDGEVNAARTAAFQ